MQNEIDNRQKWILAGYQLFGDIGPEAFNVEKLSNIVGLNRSSFYHYFGDMEVYESNLLRYHISRYEFFYELIKVYDKFEMLFSQEVMQYKAELAFQRQLMIHESVSRYKKCSDDARKFTKKKPMIFGLHSAMSVRILRKNGIYFEQFAIFTLYAMDRKRREKRTRNQRMFWCFFIAILVKQNLTSVQIPLIYSFFEIQDGEVLRF